MGVKYKSTSLDMLQLSFETMYETPTRGRGHRLGRFAGSCMHVPHGAATPTATATPQPHPCVSRMADKRKKFTQPYQLFKRFPDKFAAKARKTLSSLVPAMAKNSTYFRDSPTDAYSNAVQVQDELLESLPQVLVAPPAGPMPQEVRHKAEGGKKCKCTFLHFFALCTFEPFFALFALFCIFLHLFPLPCQSCFCSFDVCDAARSWCAGTYK